MTGPAGHPFATGFVSLENEDTIPCATGEDVFTAVGLPFNPPEERR